MRFKYTGPYNPDFDGMIFTVEFGYPVFNHIKFKELSYPIDCAYFLKYFDEYTDAFHKKLDDVVNDKVD